MEVGRVGRDREDAERVRVAETALPALYGDDRRASLDDVEIESVAQAEADTVVHLSVAYQSARTLFVEGQLRAKDVRRSATGAPRCHGARGTRRGIHHGGGGSAERSARYE